MSVATLSRRRRRGRPARSIRASLQVELLESRCLLSNLNLTPLVPVSGPSPFLGNPIEANDPAVTINSEVEPYVAVDPTNSKHLVGAWIQDFARGIVAAASFNGGNTWQSVVIPGVTVASGGAYPHSSDPWVSFAPNGDVYLSLLVHDLPEEENPNAILVSKSTDGGLSWGGPTTLIADNSFLNEKPSITADPSDARFAYAAWTGFTPRSIANRQTAMFSRTTDGGKTWEPARVIFDPGPHNQAIGFQIVVLPDGTLVSVF
ncbi:MAG TPA: sialidase family protein, partial [Gemmataceae bacterium]|nr:sialidase family protein [Gemmataceae bacterium]